MILLIRAENRSLLGIHIHEDATDFNIINCLLQEFCYKRIPTQQNQLLKVALELLEERKYFLLY